MGKEKENKETVMCPVGKFFSELEETFGKKSEFYNHITGSRIEFLKAIRTLVDDKIEDLEKKKAGKPQKKATKIKVE